VGNASTNGTVDAVPDTCTADTSLSLDRYQQARGRTLSPARAGTPLVAFADQDLSPALLRRRSVKPQLRAGLRRMTTDAA
jgi:hypothetical protein